jgi:hypothetical protein
MENENAPGEATAEAVEAALHQLEPEPEHVMVGGTKVHILLLKRRWQVLFARAVLPMYSAELSGTESIQKAAVTGIADFTSLSEILINSEIKSDENLDRAAAVVLASQINGAGKQPEVTIAERMEWLQSNSTTEEMLRLVEAQAKKERLIESIGERLPARLLRTALIIGDKTATLDSIKQGIAGFLPQLRVPAPAPTGDGTTAKEEKPHEEIP